MGETVATGRSLMENGPRGDPVRAAYTYYTYGVPRFSWDPLTVLYAIRGLGDYFTFGNVNGYNHIELDGSNRWIPDENVRTQHWLKLKKDNVSVGVHLDRMFLEGARSVVKRPAPWFTPPGPPRTRYHLHGEL